MEGIMTKEMSKVVGMIDPSTFDAGNPVKIRELRKAGKKQALEIVWEYVSERGIKNIVDVGDFAKKVMSDTGTTLSFPSVKDACFEIKWVFAKKKERTFQRAVDLAVNKLNEGLDFQKILEYFEDIPPSARYSDVAEMSKKAKLASVHKAQEIREKKLVRKIADGVERRREFNRPLAKALREVAATL